MKTRGLRSQLEETALANYLRLDVPLGDMSLGDMPSDLDDISAMDKYRPGHRALLVSRFCFALTGQTIQPIISPTALRHLHPESLDYVRRHLYRRIGHFSPPLRNGIWWHQATMATPAAAYGDPALQQPEMHLNFRARDQAGKG